MDGCSASNSIKGIHERDADGRCWLCGDGAVTHWRTKSSPLPVISNDEKEAQAARMADLICELIHQMGGLPSTAHGVAAALCKALEERKGKR
jgi:hypothetical protein